MGWKFAIAVIGLKNRPLDQALASLYGRKTTLKETQHCVEDILYPDNDKQAYACVYHDQAWVFDWPYVMKSVEDGYKGEEDVDFYLLLSTTNLYGFAKYEKGKERRRRAGSSDDGFYADKGELVPAEREAVLRMADNVASDQILAAWTDANEIAEGPDDELTHDAMGEDVVFAVMEAQTRFRLDRASQDSDKFIEKTVLEIVGAKKRFGLF